jgi:uncharacterized protein YkwD
MLRFCVRFRVLVVAAALLASCVKRTSDAQFGQGPLVVATATPQIQALERKMASRLNRDRAKKALPPLAYDGALADIARAHSKDMRERGFFAHDSPFTGSLQDRLDRAGYLARNARENLGEGADIDGAQDLLLNSPGHYANIMSKDVTHIGIGILDVGSKQQPKLLVTQVFASPVNGQDPAAARSVMVQRIAQARRAAGLRPLPSHPLLEKLAKKHISDVHDGQDGSANQRIGDAIVSKLEGSGLGGVAVATTVFLTPDMYEPTGLVAGPAARGYGLATAAGRDPQGRPAIKALILIGQ